MVNSAEKSKVPRSAQNVGWYDPAKTEIWINGKTNNGVNVRDDERSELSTGKASTKMVMMFNSYSVRSVYDVVIIEAPTLRCALLSD